MTSLNRTKRLVLVQVTLSLRCVGEASLGSENESAYARRVRVEGQEKRREALFGTYLKGKPADAQTRWMDQEPSRSDGMGQCRASDRAGEETATRWLVKRRSQSCNTQMMRRGCARGKGAL